MQESYQVIARRWRPKQFADLVGQEHIVRTLTNAIELNRIAHAYLFVGSRGTGKTSTARLFAMALNAEGTPSISIDENAPIAQAIMRGSCIDVVEIDGASNNSVDQVRDLREACQYAPAQCRFKIYIIDEVHMLTTAAFNALLKTLEEPPPHVKFIFATTEAHKVLPTIVSRCQRFEFRPISDNVIAEKLARIAEAEKLDVAPAVFKSIARLAQGSMRDAQSILDQLISFCGDKIVESDILDVYGLASVQTLSDLTKAMAVADYSTLISLVNQLEEQGRDFYRVLCDLQSQVHHALIDAIAQKGFSDLLGTSMSTESLMRMLETLQAGETTLRLGFSEKMSFELTLLKAIEQSRVRAIDSLIKEVSRLTASLPPEEEDSFSKKKTSSLEPQLDPAPALEETPICDLPGPQVDAPHLQQAIDQIPPSTRKCLDTLFRVQFKEVRSLK